MPTTQTFLISIPKDATPVRAIRIYQQNDAWINSFNWNKWDVSFPAANESDLESDAEYDFLEWARKYGTARKRKPTKKRKTATKKVRRKKAVKPMTTTP